VLPPVVSQSLLLDGPSHGAARTDATARAPVRTVQRTADTHWLLVRRRNRTGELAFYRAYTPTPVPLSTLVLVAGRRWAVDRRSSPAKNSMCTVAERRIDPLEMLGIAPGVPLPYWGWSDIPDQYGRRWDGDDGESRRPTNPKGSDLPELGPWQWRRQR
jgi:hypothetical protein